jgi:FAD/FMN-containing dehydrogenase
VLLRNFRDIRVDLASETVTVGASVQMVDVRDALRPYGMQTEVTPEIGNATAGSVACCGTKDASVGDGLAQVSSTVVRVRLVDARGDVEEVSEDSDPERLRVIRSSYGLLGVIFEVTFRIQPSVTLRYDYTSFRLYPPPSTAEMRGDADGMLGLAQPYANKIVIERRYIDNDVSRPISRLSNLKRGIRDKVWEFGVSFVPTLWPSNRVYDLVDRSVGPVLLSLGAMGGFRARRSDSTIRFRPRRRNVFDFTFWALPVGRWAEFVPAYLAFCEDYRRETGFRVSLISEVYLMNRDEHSLLSPTAGEERVHDGRDGHPSERPSLGRVLPPLQRARSPIRRAPVAEPDEAAIQGDRRADPGG